MKQSIFVQSFKHLLNKKGLDSASVLSFSTMFAIIPTLALAFSVFSLSPYFADFQYYLENFLFKQLLPQNYDIAVVYMQQFIISAQKIKGVSIIFLLIVAILLFHQVDKQVNNIWNKKYHRHLGWGLLTYILTLLIGPLLLGASLFASSYIAKSDIFVFVPMGRLLVSSLPIVLSAFGLAALYYVIPSNTPSIKNSIKAGFVGAIFLEFVKSLMLIYLNYFPLYKIIYGTLSMIMLFMLWVFFSWLIVLFGASFCFCLEKEERDV